MKEWVGRMETLDGGTRRSKDTEGASTQEKEVSVCDMPPEDTSTHPIHELEDRPREHHHHPA